MKDYVYTKKKLLFGILTVVLGGLAVELGAWILSSFSAGKVLTWSDLDREKKVVFGLPRTHEEDEVEPDWSEHRIGNPPTLHPFLGFVHSPTEEDERHFDRQSGNYGFPKNQRNLFAPTGDEIVVGIFGGSFAYNLGLGSPVIEKRLEKLDRFAGRNVRVLNLAAGGYKQPQQLMALNYLLALGAHFDVVLNLDGFNEIALAPVTNIALGYFPFYPRGWPLLVGRLDQPTRRAIGELAFHRERRRYWADLFRGRWLRYSMTAGLVWRIRDAVLAHRVSVSEMALLSRENDSHAELQARGPTRTYATESEMYDDLVAFWRRSSRQMDGLCRSQGIEYHHFLQPNQYLPDSKPLSAEELETAWKADHPYRDAVAKGYPRLIATGRDLRRDGMAFHDLTQIYADHEETLYRDSCCHVNRNGYVLVLAAILDALESEPAGPEGVS